MIFLWINNKIRKGLRLTLKNPLQQLEQSGLAGVTLNDNAAPAANVYIHLLKVEGEDLHLLLQQHPLEQFN